ncbi:MAG: 3-hydroxyacyl-CoA dehydrogenase [Bacteroidetes bacterium]|nr:3-hydroxyacyl-CoA dehydrogenase [Bacteroidota bacterium]
MNIGILASTDRRNAWPSGSEAHSQISWAQNSQDAAHFDVFIDLNFDAHPERIRNYAGNTKTIFLLSAVNYTPEAAFFHAGIPFSGEKIFGINAIPGFLERNTLEISDPFGKKDETDDLLNKLPFSSLEWVKSRVGMVTPRIVFMIINEAYYTMQEGTAAAPDIDTAMRLGTAYPHGPFEWKAKCGIANVYRTLEAMYEDTKEERYKICPALKTEYLTGGVC